MMLKAVLDIGKTHLKLAILEADQLLACFNSKNNPVDGLYLQANTNRIWQWLCESLKSYPRTSEIAGIIVTTHGATAALVNTQVSERSEGLVLPIVDYEFTGVDECEAAYAQLRPDFTETFSPQLPVGLNLAKQLFWQQRNFPVRFGKATHILLYPQYWAWRLGGEPATEVTSLGCHTDLWHPLKQSFSTLVDKCHWHTLFAPLKNAWDTLGSVSQSVAEETGLSVNCRIYTGLHDSNASLLRYLCCKALKKQPMSIVSTGTWTIVMQTGGDNKKLKRSRDMLANVNILGQTINCARFMGGREYEAICQLLKGSIDEQVTCEAIQQAIDNNWLVTPDFSGGNGPFAHAVPALLCPENPPSAQAIATLYCALMIDQRLDDLNAIGPIYIEGAFLKNPLLCQLVAQLRANQPVYLSQDNTGTVTGAAALIDFNPERSRLPAVESCRAATFTNLPQYKAKWQQATLAKTLNNGVKQSSQSIIN